MCCDVTIQPFNNASSTSIAYAGGTPNVDVYTYFGGVLQQDEFAVITFMSGIVHVDHGGPASGFIRVW